MTTKTHQCYHLCWKLERECLMCCVMCAYVILSYSNNSYLYSASSSLSPSQFSRSIIFSFSFHLLSLNRAYIYFCFYVCRLVSIGRSCRTLRQGTHNFFLTVEIRGRDHAQEINEALHKQGYTKVELRWHVRVGGRVYTSVLHRPHVSFPEYILKWNWVCFEVIGA